MTLRFGVIGAGLMGKEFASAAARWLHLEGLPFRPVITGVCDVNESAAEWFERQVPSVDTVTTDYRSLLDHPNIDAVYCAVPHNLHEQMYCDIVESGTHLLGEKPFGIDAEANAAINRKMARHPEAFVRCSSEFPFYPGAFQIAQWVREKRFGEIIEVEAGFWHSSDLNPNKPINWKRMIDKNGEYGCMGDLGMHVLHLPFRFGWYPKNVRALLANVVRERPGKDGALVPCETWDNAILSTEVTSADGAFPMTLSTKRIAPGHGNTWFIRIWGTAFSAEFSTANPKQIRYLPYEAGGSQAWHVEDVSYKSAYPAITGGIFEFGFPDAILQMWAAFCDELVNGDEMQQPLYCVTPEEAAASHVLFTAALESQRNASTVELNFNAP